MSSPISRRSLVVGRSAVARALVEQLAGGGHRVGHVCRDEQEASPAAEWFVTETESADESADALVAVVRERFGTVDQVFLAEMVLQPANVTELAAGDWWASLEWNLVRPAVYGSRLLAVVSDPGAMVLLSSIDGTHGNSTYPTYSVARGGVLPLVHMLAEAAGPRCRVNAVALGGVVEGFIDPLGPVARSFVNATPLARLGHPGEVATAMTFLASPEASYINATVLTVDGGRLAITPGTRT